MAYLIPINTKIGNLSVENPVQGKVIYILTLILLVLEEISLFIGSEVLL